jgi:hypothetical protein
MNGWAIVIASLRDGKLQFRRYPSF